MKQPQKEHLIPEPCHLKWSDLGKDEMRNDGHIARMCDQCQHHVHDLSGMSAQQIIDLKENLQQKGQELCGMVRQPSSSRLQRFSLMWIAAMAPIALVACAGIQTETPEQNIEYQEAGIPLQAPIPLPISRFPAGVVGKVAIPPKP